MAKKIKNKYMKYLHTSENFITFATTIINTDTMTQITLIKNYRNRETLRLVDIQELISAIRTGEYAEAVGRLRNIWPLARGKKSEDGSITVWQDEVKDLPRICFAFNMETHKGLARVKGYTGLVLLEVNNLTGSNEAEAVRRGAAEMPQTLMAFVGADGESVKIVCKGELYPNLSQSQGDRLPGTESPEPLLTPNLPEREEDVRLFHRNLYERARLIYNGQLGVTIEKLEPLPERICYMADDAQLVYNPMATPIYARMEEPTEQMVLRPSTFEATEGESGADRYISLQTAYEFNLTKAYDLAEGITNEAEHRHAVLTSLAESCMQTGIPMAVARRLVMMRPSLSRDALLVQKVFENAYREEHVSRYLKRKGIKPMRNLPPETLLTMKINIFLNENYELRKNVMRGVAEYRQRTGLGFSFSDLTEEARNSITMRALEVGIKCWDKDIRRYVNSDDITPYDPVNDYLDRIGPWDGEDRVAELAARIPTDYEEWPHLFHIWLRSMVAMWLGKGQLTGNALVPLLIGRQGCGKSSFCRILMPRELQDYYNDRINFKNEADLNLGLTSFALINLDEFDRVTQRQQIVLKYLLSTAELKYRPPYGKAYSSHRRYASFIGTTNEPTPLTDPTGSRRFICVSINGNIDFQTPVYHDQLYAQLLQEIRDGERYWLTKDEERALMSHNLQYQQLNGLGEMLLSIVQRPKEDDPDGQWMTLKELSELLKKHFKGYKEETNSFQKIGNYLNRPEYKFLSRHTTAGSCYWVKKIC